MSADPVLLEQEGWERRFMVAGERIEETAELYRRLGYAVRLEHPSAEELREECGDCRLALAFFRVVYTRRAP
jgi:hypothetical protein